MDRVFLGEASTCAECERVLWDGEPAYCGSTRGPDCVDLCNGGSECVTLCGACLRGLVSPLPNATLGRVDLQNLKITTLA
jgi:hypothetical protein